MSVVRLLDCQHGSSAAPNLNQQHYVNWVRFIRECAERGLCTIVANNFGIYSGAGTGEDFHDGTDPAREGAFIVAAWPTFTIIVAWQDFAAFGAAPNDPGLMDASTQDGVAVAMAFREDGTSPWAGGTAAAGADTKGATVWTPGGSIVHAFPRSNNTGGTHDTLKQNMMRVGADDSSGDARAHWVANEDGIFQLFSVGDNGAYVGSYFGRYLQQAGLSTTAPYMTHPFCAIAYYQGMWPFSPTYVFGGTSGNSARQGGIVGRISDGVRDLSLELNQAGLNATMQPNQMGATPSYARSPIVVCQNEIVSCRAGTLPTELVEMVYGPDNHQMNAAGDRSYLGVATADALKWAITHDGGAALGTNGTREGRLSYTA